MRCDEIRWRHCTTPHHIALHYSNSLKRAVKGVCGIVWNSVQYRKAFLLRRACILSSYLLAELIFGIGLDLGNLVLLLDLVFVLVVIAAHRRRH